MKVYILEPTTTIGNKVNISEIMFFSKIVKEQFDCYGIEYYCVQRANYKRFILKLDNDSLIVAFNGYLNTYYDFLKEALNKKSKIFPVAFDKENRKPSAIISDKQSFDVYDQLKRRNLSNDYIEIPAKVFARKIISECMPTICNDNINIFLSHRRLDGEEITAYLCNTLNVLAPEKKFFRDIVNVNIGENAQDVIDTALVYSDVLVFFHTNLSATSDWVLKEILYALINNIPILWVKIGNPNIKSLKYMPSEKPHLEYPEEDFSNPETLNEIADQILDKSYELLLDKSNDVYDEMNCITDLLDDKLELVNDTKMLYTLSLSRKGYSYPQRTIKQFVQFFGRIPKQSDADDLKSTLARCSSSEFDSAVMLSKRVITRTEYDDIISDSFDDFYYTYFKYLKGNSADLPYDIVISGAFPDSDEIFKQNLTYSLICFVKEILKEGFNLCFGAHPTFQELIFDTAKNVTKNHIDKVKMYVSNYFVPHDNVLEFKNRCSPVEIDKVENNRILSLTELREKLIYRDSVKALICLGGKIKENKSEEGIREEIDIAKSKGIPVFLIGSVGGCSSIIAEDYAKNDNWNELNDASKELNTSLMQGIDYKKSARLVIDYIKQITKEE
ncbi:TIR domain-containing protein [Ruminococcus intestinalis]|uniref:SLOG domain-containing protein n=1 Tax=Ruminococcus intestinalis TaxID=2763066 RepID=UPI003F801A66